MVSKTPTRKKSDEEFLTFYVGKFWDASNASNFFDKF